MIVTIDGVEIKEPQGLDYEFYRLTKAERLSNGDMTMDPIAKKRKLNLSYTVLSSAEWKKIYNILMGDNVFFTVTYEDDGATETLTCYAGAMRRRKFRTNTGWHYKNVTFALIER